LPLWGLLAYNEVVLTDALKQSFAPVARRAFRELGLVERELIEYVSDVLSAFARSDHLYRLRSLEGKPIDSVVENLRRPLMCAR
jgi:hypothetical protein